MYPPPFLLVGYLHGGQPAPAGSISVHPQQTVDPSVKQGAYAEDQGHYQHKLQGQVMSHGKIEAEISF